MSSYTGRLKYPVIVIGGGIGGLGVSIALAKQGHPVTVLERRSPSYITNSSGGISLWQNARRILIEELDLKDELASISDETNKVIFCQSTTGDAIRELSKPEQTDLLRILHNRAIKLGVDIQLGKQITGIDDLSSPVVVSLSDSTKLEAGLVIGADGIDSQTRTLIFPDSDVAAVPTGDCVFLVNTTREIMLGYPETARIWNDLPYHLHHGANRAIVSWTMTSRQLYHLQFCEYDYGHGFHYGFTEQTPDTEPWVRNFPDMATFSHLWRDYSPGIRHILASTNSSIKWKIGQVPPLDSWSSKTGRVILLGDAAHGFPPFAGQGACTTLEDAAALARLISLESTPSMLRKIAKVYYGVRRKRIEGMLRVIWGNIASFADSEQARQRAEDQIAALDEMNESGATPKWQMGKMWTDGREKWLTSYDAVTEVEEYWKRCDQDGTGKCSL